MSIAGSSRAMLIRCRRRACATPDLFAPAIARRVAPMRRGMRIARIGGQGVSSAARGRRCLPATYAGCVELAVPLSKARPVSAALGSTRGVSRSEIKGRPLEVARRRDVRSRVPLIRSARSPIRRSNQDAIASVRG
jgi:hypothetical protein